MFSANIRLPRSYSVRDKIDRVNQIIDDLDLHSCINTFIGTDFVRGVSGGERKRTSIGMELILSPKILFLDEPTTG
jgi:ATP-binding cassette subfamily G (WHITE) protein 2